MATTLLNAHCDLMYTRQDPFIIDDDEGLLTEPSCLEQGIPQFPQFAEEEAVEMEAIAQDILYRSSTISSLSEPEGPTFQ